MNAELNNEMANKLRGARNRKVTCVHRDVMKNEKVLESNLSNTPAGKKIYIQMKKVLSSIYIFCYCMRTENGKLGVLIDLVLHVKLLFLNRGGEKRRKWTHF